MEKFEKSCGIYDTPPEVTGDYGDSRVEGLERNVLNDNQAVPAYKVPWEAYGHLDDASPDIVDACWGVQDGKRNIRQLKKIKEL